ncbi:hypothetical protein BKA70DRAFT_604985 [Coprinopsis sp. MPI-PUGE-AT-0042]|nr:hypothetical protein BKA70DRAFT_604985 [Coprinopsis sp. MPI-PUGE-AT-0042]
MSDQNGGNTTSGGMGMGGGGGGQQGPMGPRLQISYAELNVQLISIGLQLFMCLYGLTIFLESPRNARKGRLSYVLVSFTILSLCIMWVVTGSYSGYHTLLNTVPGDRQRSQEAMQRFGRGTAAYGVGRIASTFIAFVGDGLLLYRCYFFWTDKKWVVIVPALTYVASVVMGLLQMLWIEVFPGWDIDYSVAWISLTAALNALITATISFRLLVTYYKNKEYLPSTSSKVYLSVVAILVEAALPLSIIGIVLACFINQSGGSGASKPHQGIFRILYFFFLAISPQMIIFRVMTGRAAGRDLRGNPPTTTNISTGIEFNPSSESGEHSTVAPYDQEKKNHSLRSRSQGLSTIGTEKRDQAHAV